MQHPAFICILSVLLIGHVFETDCVKSGVYIDNGRDQTILQHELTRIEKQEMETELLSILGLPNNPPRKISTKSKLKKAATKFMIEIYKSMMEKENSPSRLTRNADLNITHQDLNAVDAVMTFESHDKYVSGVRHERGKRLWFDVSEVPAGEVVIGAELRIYQKMLPVEKITNKYTITVYQVIESEHNKRELEFITSMNTTNDHEGWLELNVTEAFISWVAFPHSNKGLYFSVHLDDNPAREIKPEEIGLVIVKGDDDEQPFLVAFFKSYPSTVKVRKPRGTGRKRKSETSASNPAYYSQMTESNQMSKNCQIQMLYVSFKELQWQNWIIAPQGFEAFYCTGECNFPLNAHMNATNHAIVQTLVHLITPYRAPKPCCAPTKLSAISVLFFLDDSDVVLKKYRNIVVKSCGCH